MHYVGHLSMLPGNPGKRKKGTEVIKSDDGPAHAYKINYLRPLLYVFPLFTCRDTPGNADPPVWQTMQW